jgi:CheY-like chemotaxis protein
LLGPVLGERISFSCSPSPAPVSVFIDPVRLDQALVNLVLNARDAIDDRGFIRISSEVVNESPPAGGGSAAWVRIRVTDSGRGMCAAVAERAFEPHFTTKDVNGCGLGLAIVRDTVVEVGGSISVASTPGMGTTIDILLPATLAPGESSGDASRSAIVGGSETVVVVEDDAALRQSIVRTLHDAGYSVVEVPTAIDGVWLSDQLLSRASLIIADEMLPDSPGHELVATFRHREPGMPVLYTSGYPLTPGVARQLDDRTDFLAKPFDRASLLRRVRSLIDGVPQ